MGEQRVLGTDDARQARAFRRRILEDLRALERLLEEGRFETSPLRIGAEQELFLVDEELQPAPIALQLLEALADHRFCSEVGLFNLEANCTPRLFAGDCLSALERELRELLGRVREAAAHWGADAALAGILPTIHRSHLGLEHMTPGPRYTALTDASLAAHGGRIDVRIEGIDTFEMHVDSIMFDACTTSFQVHLQVAPADFAAVYNCAQLAAAPQMAAAANSALLFGQRVWHETRIPLIERGSDFRTLSQRQRGGPARVGLGNRWVEASVLELFRNDVAHAHQILSGPLGESALSQLARGELPGLDALRLFNGTVWRWNRPCYGVSGEKAHLRIENRVLPAGPTLADEIANAAFWLGLMTEMPRAYPDLARRIPFDDALANFHAASRQGLQAELRWLDGEHVSAQRLILDRLLPLAVAGLRRARVDAGDAERFLGIFAARVRSGRTGAQWALDSFDRLLPGRDRRRVTQIVTAAMQRQAAQEEPVHRWRLADAQDEAAAPLAFDTVEKLMSTHVVAVRHDEPLELVEAVCAWEGVGHLPVEDETGKLVGIVSRDVVQRRLQRAGTEGDELTVADVMQTLLPVVSVDLPIDDALDAIGSSRERCLLVLHGERLVGIVTREALVQAAKALRARRQPAVVAPPRENLGVE